jgi:hypothetical protein
MIGQLLPNTNEMLQCILAIQILDLNTASAENKYRLTSCWFLNQKKKEEKAESSR